MSQGIIEAGHVFFHEATHAETGAGDPDKEFRDYLSRLLSSVACTAFGRSLLDGNSVAKGVSVSDISRVEEMLRSEISEDGKENPFGDILETLSLLEEMKKKGISIGGLKRLIEEQKDKEGADL